MANIFMGELAKIYKVALESVDPKKLILNNVKLSGKRLIIEKNKNDSLAIDLEGCNLHLIGGGKSVLEMAKGLTEVVNQSTNLGRNFFTHGCLSVPIGQKDNFQGESQSLLEYLDTKVLFGSANNLPDKESLEASKSIFQNISKAITFDKDNNKRSIFLVLLSGGGSACLTYPNYLDLETKLNLVKFLTQRGADIVELNKVRRFFSKIKGGKLARYILENRPDAQIISLIISDVIGNPLEFIASGPTHISTFDNQKQEMLDILEKYKYPMTGAHFPVTGRTNNDPSLENQITNVIIGNNSVALEALIMEANKFHYKVECLGDGLSGRTEDIVARLIDHGQKNLAQERCQKHLIVGGGEATILRNHGDSWGLGGRTQEMALDYMIHKVSNDENSCDNQIDVLLSASTDGQDGPTDVAACFASLSDWNGERTLEEMKLAKRNHDSFRFWTETKPNWLLKTGLTGTNVMDLYIYCLWLVFIT